MIKIRKQKRKILTSQCLYGGEPVRYDGKSKSETNPIYLKWKEEGRLVPVCPEVFGGLPTPRPDAQIAPAADKSPATVDQMRIVNRQGTDVTRAFRIGAEEAVRLAKAENVAFAVMKEKSPSCGSSLVYDGTFSGNKIPGEGLTVRMLRAAGIKVFSERELDQARSRLSSLEADESNKPSDK